MATRFGALRRLGIPPLIQLDFEAARALEALVTEMSQEAVSAAVESVAEENRARYASSPKLRRVLPRHVEAARARLGKSSRPEPQEPNGE